jgi:uncharacterized membrane protein YphA (DoxX/SURF4 family)
MGGYKGLSFLEKYRGFAPAVLRLFLGAVFLSTAYMKAFIFTPQGFAQTIGFMPFPLFFAWLVIVCEGIGGLLLILGLWVRWTSVPLLIVLLVAFFMNAPDGWSKVWLPFWGIGALLALLLWGAGRLSLERKVLGKER